MGTKIFLDTNIFIDYLVESRQKHLFARQIVGNCYSGAIQGCVSETVLTNTAYVLRKALNQNQLHFIIGGFCSFMEVLGASSTIIAKACTINIKDIEDAILYQIALDNNCTYFITTNIEDFADIAQPKLKVVTPEDFLNGYEMAN